jgi:hypothetical protein
MTEVDVDDMHDKSGFVAAGGIALAVTVPV